MAAPEKKFKWPQRFGGEAANVRIVTKLFGTMISIHIVESAVENALFLTEIHFIVSSAKAGQAVTKRRAYSALQRARIACELILH
jgi:hypothetical protein